MPSLYLIDGYAQFFRAYHAIRTPMTSPVTKEPTNMTFGFVGMLLKLLKADSPAMHAWGGPPDYMAVALDVSGDRGTFRSGLYPEYKTNRPPPDGLKPQVERCIAMLREIGVPVLFAEGFEADDVVATIVDRLASERPDVDIRMVSKDKDLKQLLTEEGDARRVEIFDVHKDEVFDARALREQSGLRPGQVVDMLALMGDTVDNVPGVEGVGDKTSAQLICEYGSLDALLARADEIKGKRGEKLREAAPRLALSRELVTLRRDVPVEFDLESARADALRIERLIPIFKELGFNRYQDEVRALLGERAVMPVTGVEERSGRAEAGPPRGAKKARESEQALGGLFDAHEAQRVAAEPRVAQSGTYHAVTTRERLDALVAQMKAAPIISLDTETTSLSPRDAKLCGISVCVRAGEAYYIPTLTPTPDRHLDTKTVLDALRPLLEDPARYKAGHNLKYDVLIFRAHGVTLRGVAFDSMVASYLIDASRSSHSLDALALALLGRTNISITELIGTGKNQRTFDTVPMELATQYAAEDADVAMQLHDLMLPQLRMMGLAKLFDEVEMPLVGVLAEMEWNGIAVDPAELERQRARIHAQVEKLLADIKAQSKAAIGRAFDPDSTKQLGAALFNKPDDDPPGLGIRGQKRTKTGYSTDAEVLDKLAQDDTLASPIPRLILEYRQLSKLLSTYLVALREAIHPATGRIHSSFHQTVAATGRLASSDPNLQNIPIRTDVGREIRRAFVAPPGRVLLTADYSQIELRLLAHLSGDPALIEAFMQGEDIHTAVAAQIRHKKPGEVTREERNGAKMVNFGIVYGVTPFGLARRLKVPTAEASEIIDAYKRRFAGITTFLQECIEQARANGYVVTMLGRRRPIPDIESNNPSKRALAERLAINSVVQGSAADMIKVAMVNVEKRLEEARAGDACADKRLAEVLMLLQIHDELVLECPEPTAPPALGMVVAEMERAMSLKVPLKADARIGKNWFESK